MTCQLCTGPCYQLGSLGQLKWFVCRNCGMQFSRKARAKKVRKNDSVRNNEATTSDRRG